jgi:hydroxyethylthiazole kinase
MNPGEALKKVRQQAPVVHHLTNWVTIYDCANVLKVLGASPVMAHAAEEVEEMAGIAQALVLNIGTLTADLVEAMKKAAKAANKKGIPVVLDVCGAGATRLRDRKSFELLDEARIDIIKGNASEVARICGEKVATRGVDAAKVEKDLIGLAKKLALERKCAVVVTGKEDVITDGEKTILVNNGEAMMSRIVGTGCMASSVIGAFAAVQKDPVEAAACALAVFEVAAENAVKESRGPGSFKEALFDQLYLLTPEIADQRSKLSCV